jgi:hypothetical protein
MLFITCNIFFHKPTSHCGVGCHSRKSSWWTGGSVHRLSADVKKTFPGKTVRNVARLHDGCEPMRFTDTNLTYDISKCYISLFLCLTGQCPNINLVYFFVWQVNVPVGNVQVTKADLTEIPRCECTEEMACSKDTDCLNRMLMYECHPSLCPSGDKCQNQRFQKRQYPEAVPYKTPGRGWGLKTRFDIKRVRRFFSSCSGLPALQYFSN